MKAYKLTDQNAQTYNGTQWGEGVTHRISPNKNKSKLCTDSWIHFYTHPLLAVLLNPLHAAFKYPRLWECEINGECLHEPLKSGCKILTTIKEIPLPNISTTQKIAFAILCAKQVCEDEKWNIWADNWLNCNDRSCEAAAAAYAAYAAATNAAAYAAAAAYDAAAAYAAAAAYNAYATTNAAAAAYAAAYAACDAQTTNKQINFVELAEQAMNY